MKKKVFSKLLMVALVATVGAFTSCKDYDDDINDLRSQINGLETSLKATIDKNASDAANSLAILEKQLADVKVAYADADAALDTQLKALKNDVSTAMTSLQGGIDANKANIASNLEAINNLKSEVASLKTAVGTLEAAKESLEKSLKETNDLLKSQGETIATLVQTDQNLEKGINEAKALATKAQEAADAAQRAADKVAADLATLTTQEANDVANLQKQISDNLASLTKKIDDMNAALDARIKTNTQSISDLATKVAENYATIVYVDKQIEAVKAANTKVANDLAAAQTDLEAKIKNCGDAAAKALQDANDAIMKAVKEGNDAQDKALEAAEKRLKEADDKQDAYLAEKLIEINTKIGDVTAQAGATAISLDLLKQKEAADIEALTQKHDADLDLFKNQVITEIIPAQVATQVAYYVPKAMQDFFDKIIKPYVDGVDEKHTTLLNEFIERFEADSIKMDAYLAGEYLLAIQALVGDTADVLRDEMALTAQNLKDAYEFADNQLKQNLQGQIDDMNNPEKEGSLANLLKTAKENLQGQITTANGKIEAIETFLGKSEEGFSYETLAASIAETEVFGNAIENAVKEAYGEILSMVTSINLYANQHQAQDGEGGFDGFDHTLVFSYIVEKDDVKFPADATVADKQITFQKGMFRSYNDSILVRVSPTNAKLTTDQIALFNSQGENIVADGVIDVVAVKPYKRDKYITRGENTGLWVIKFKIKEDKLGTGFKDAAYTYDARGNQLSILYAVAAKSGETAQGAAPRYVVSEYDLDLATADAYPAWDFTVNGVNVANIHNRYIETDLENVPTDITEGIAKTNFRNELTWIGVTNGEQMPYSVPSVYKKQKQAYKDLVPATKVITEGDNKNAVDRYNHSTQDLTNGVDNRHMKDILEVSEGEPIKIVFPDFYNNDKNYPILVKGFYVTLDHDFALESKTSEINAWTGYEYENVGFYKTNKGEVTFIKPATLFERADGKTEGTITVKALNNVKGDVIGFRVFAVNIDGTLYDPDGRAFYVRVGKTYETRDLSFTVFTETKSTSGAIQDSVNHKNPIIAQNEIFNADKTNTEEPFFNVDPGFDNLVGDNYNFVFTWGKNNPKIRAEYSNEMISVTEGTTSFINSLFKFRNSDESPAPYALGSGKYYADFGPSYKTQNVSVQLLDATRLIDNQTYNLVLTIYNRNSNDNNADNNLTGASIVEKVNIKVTKKMPDYLPEAFGVRISQEDNAQDMKFYLRPIAEQGTWTIDGTWFNGGKADWGKSNIDDKNEAGMKDYRWATDVRPFNFEEIFNGLIDDSYADHFNPYYQFQFDACGSYAKDDASKAAISQFKKKYEGDTGASISYTGLNTGRTAKENHTPGYYLPYVHYGVVGKSLSVKASYRYQNVSLTVNADGSAKVGEYISKPIYFDKDGKEVAAAQAAFKAQFLCAIDETFGLTLTAPSIQVDGTNNYGTTVATAVPYGANFTVVPGALQAGITWTSNLAALTYWGTSTAQQAYAASYFRTNFSDFTDEFTYTTLVNGWRIDNGKSSYRMTNLVVNPEEATNGWATVSKAVRKQREIENPYFNPRRPEGPLNPRNITQTYTDYEAQNWLKLVDVKLADKQLAISKIRIFKPGSTSDVEVEISEANKNMDRVNDYFTVTKSGTNGLYFKFKDAETGSSHTPANLGVFEITLTTGTLNANILHQWGHKKAAQGVTGTVKVYYNRPDSDPNLQGSARQTR